MDGLARVLGAGLARPGAAERLRSLSTVGVEADAAAAAERVAASLWAADVWRDDADAPVTWVRRAGPHARVFLLFKVAVTTRMAAAAALAGLAEDADRGRSGWAVAFRLCFA